MTERRHQWAGQFQLGLKVTDWVIRADGSRPATLLPMQATFSATDIPQVLPGTSSQQQPSPPHKVAPPSFYQTGPGWKDSRSTLLSTPAAPVPPLPCLHPHHTPVPRSLLTLQEQSYYLLVVSMVTTEGRSWERRLLGNVVSCDCPGPVSQPPPSWCAAW